MAEEKKPGLLKRIFSFGFGKKKKVEPDVEDTATAEAEEAARKEAEARAAEEQAAKEAAERAAAEQAEKAKAERRAAELEAEKKAAAEKAAAEEAQRLELERKEAEEKAAAEKAAAAKLAEAEARAKEEQARKEEAERKAEEDKKARQAAEAEKLEQQRIAEEAARQEKEAAAEKAAREEAERLAAEEEARRLELEKKEAEEKAALEKAEREAAEQAEKEEAERQALEQAEKEEAERLAAEREAEAKAAAEKVAQEEAEARAAEEQAAKEAAERAAAEQAEKAEAERRAAELEAEKEAAAEKAAAEEAQRLEAEKREAEEKAAAKKAEVENAKAAEENKPVVVAKEKPPETAPEDEGEDTERKEGWFKRLRKGLSRSSSNLKENITAVFTKKKLDEDTLQELEDILIQADLGVETAMNITDALSAQRLGKDVTDEEVRQIMADEITKVLDPVAHPLELDLEHQPHVILVVGVNGSGKTTTIGKLSQKLHDADFSTLLVAGDTFRAAAIEQLHIWGERTHAPVMSREHGADAAGLAFDAYAEAKEQKKDVMLMDTAGRLQNKKELMDELEKIIRVLKKQDPTAPHTVLLTLDATTGQNALNQVEIFKDVAGVNGLVMTKLDGTARGGILVSISAKHKLPVYFVGVGEQVEDLEPFEAEVFARAIAGLDNE